LLHAGAYYVQEASSMFVWQALEVIKHETGGRALKMLDLCAAPGGKSTLLASAGTQHLVVANEVIRQRAGILTENLGKWGQANVVVTSNDARDFNQLPGFFDVMLVDAPCSGSGLFRKDAQAVEEWSSDNVQLCSQRQQRILADALPALAEGGYLIYSTCSYSVEENEQVADWLVTEMGLAPVPLDPPADWHIVETVTDHGATGYRFYPDKLQGEGFFLAVFRQQRGTIYSTVTTGKGLPAATKADRATAAEWLAQANENELLTFDKKLLAFPEKYQQEAGILQKSLYLRKLGVTVGEVKGKGLVPHHELAVSTCRNAGLKHLELDKATALQFLKKKEFALPAGAPVGWVLMTYREQGLGWAKILPNRLNNYYPMEWRILKD
jgi:NOL1/NOP2/fmu family ribosome biogenesis protein